MKDWKDARNKSIDTYLKSSYKEVKSYERFKFLYSKMKPRLKEGDSFLDIGCAKGEFIYYLKEKLPSLNYTGLDISGELIAIAKQEPKLKGATFIVGDALSFSLEQKFDHALLSGVLSIFDDIDNPLKRMLLHIKKGGFGYIFSGFNSDDIDVLVRYRNNFNPKGWESGLNIFSLNTVKKVLSPFVRTLSVSRFVMPLDLPKKTDPIKTYTLHTKEKGRIILNGANIVRDFYILEFQKK